MKKLKQILWGAILVAIGVIWLLDVCGVADIDVFFKGWWTMFIILPCGIGLITERDKMGNLIGLCVGVILLLGTRDILPFDLLWKIFLPVVVIFIGLRMILRDFFRKSAKKKQIKLDRGAPGTKEFCATFSGQNVSYDGMVFEGAELTAVFGGIKCDLRGAILEHDVAIEVNAIFGGVDLLLPENVNVQIDSDSIFGGTSDKTRHTNVDGAVTVFIDSTCVFGGLDIK